MSIITISRGTFGGGKAVAEALAEHLKYTCISRETIVQDASAEYGIPETQLHSAILQSPGFFGSKVSTSIFNLRYLTAAIMERCKDLRTVYHGYGGHLLLKGVPKLLRVRIIAGMEYRINSAIENEGLTREGAISLIAEMDKNRAHWARSLWGVEWRDPSLFDLVLNLDTVSIESAVKTIVQVKELTEFKEDNQVHQAFEDQHIVSRIWVEIIKNKPTQGVRVEIESNKGHVNIAGDVGSLKLSNAVILIAENVEGVKSVSNNLGIGTGWVW
jgi:cytidylate kinase